jgi:hypothetical protein
VIFSVNPKRKVIFTKIIIDNNLPRRKPHIYIEESEITDTDGEDDKSENNN